MKRIIRVLPGVLVMAVLTCCMSCSDLPDTAEISPDAAPLTIRADLPALKVAIRTSECSSDLPTRYRTLRVYHPDSPIPEFYAQYDYAVKWYAQDNIVVSESIWLDCVGDGTFKVEVVNVKTDEAVTRVIEL